MNDQARRARTGEELVRRLAAAIRGAQLYEHGHPLVERAVAALAEAVDTSVADEGAITIGFIGQEIVVGDLPVPRAPDTFGELTRRLQAVGIERLTLERGVTREALARLTAVVAHPERRPDEAAAGVAPADAQAALADLPHIRVGRLSTDAPRSAPPDVANARRLYGDAVQTAETLWEEAALDRQPDPRQARALVDTLAQAVAQNRSALLALTALRRYDGYTFTHMVNVSILTMAQARSLGVDGALLREFGVAALMHDIGKVRTPAEILNKPDALTDREFAIMRRHVVDGAEILRGTPDMPALAPVVAFEHHLRLDGAGYPHGVSRDGLNLGTMLCAIADVYDAMRSQRAYQEAFPTDRIKAVLERNDGRQFDQHLVRRFCQLLGLYPPGTLVRLDTGAIGVVVAPHAPDPRRPLVRVLRDAAGAPLARPTEVALWAPDDEGPRSVDAPLDPAAFDIDPLAFL
ncbi:MAG: HD-GYP domain-containing protein [Vicinamibacterales bacterium]